MIKDSIIDKIKSLIRIEEVIGDFISLKKRGNSYLAHCPFHNEKTPSFSVSPSKNIYKCFGCDAKGDAIDFLKRLEGMSFQDTIIYLGKKYGIEIEEAEFNNQEFDNKSHKDFLYIIYNFAKEYYKNNLWNTFEGEKIGLSYLENRGIKKEYIKKFELGFSLNSWDEFLNYAKKKGYSNEALEKSGLIISKSYDGDENRKLYDRFRSRLIFPIHNIYGKIVALAGRIFNKIENVPKYINSPETDIFYKGNILYGIYQGKNSIKELDNCYLVEGYTDVISLHMIGIKNVVASGGTSLTGNQIKLLKRFTKNITIIFDGDKAGIAASLRSIDIILDQGLNVKIVILPNNEDPDSFARKSEEQKFKKYLKDHAKDFITFKASTLTKEALDDPIKRAEAIKDIMNSILAIPDAIKRSIFIRECSKILEIDEDILVSEHNKMSLSNNENNHSNKIDNKFDLSTYKFQLTIEEIIKISEKELIKLLLNYSEEETTDGELLSSYILKETEEVEFSDLMCKFIIGEYRKAEQENKNLSINVLLNNKNEELKNFIIDLISEKIEISPNWEDRLHHTILKETDDLENTAYKLILKLKLNILRKLVIENQKLIKNDNEEDILERLNIHSYLKKKEKEITTKLGIVTIDMQSIKK